jgi:hypothetical protein
MKLVGSLAILLGLALFVNGLLMLRDPLWWYGAVPTVPTTGPFNQHFVRDIGLMYVLTGVGFVVGALRPALRIAVWGAATAFHVMHGGLHIWETLVGICAPSTLAQDVPAVMTPAVLGIGLLVCIVRFPSGPLRSA